MTVARVAPAGCLPDPCFFARRLGRAGSAVCLPHQFHSDVLARFLLPLDSPPVA